MTLVNKLIDGFVPFLCWVVGAIVLVAFGSSLYSIAANPNFYKLSLISWMVYGIGFITFAWLSVVYILVLMGTLIDKFKRARK